MESEAKALMERWHLGGCIRHRLCWVEVRADRGVGLAMMSKSRSLGGTLGGSAVGSAVSVGHVGKVCSDCEAKDALTAASRSFEIPHLVQSTHSAL